MDKTRHPKIYAGKLSPVAWGDVQRGLEALRDCTEATSRDAVLHALRLLVPELREPEPGRAPDTQPDEAPLAALSPA